MEDIPSDLKKEIISYIEDKKLYQKYFLEYIHLKTINFSDIDFVSYYTEKHHNEGRYTLKIRANHKAEEPFFKCKCILRRDGTQQYQIDESIFEYEILPKHYIAELFNKHFNEENSIGVKIRIPSVYLPLARSCFLMIGAELVNGYPMICTRVANLIRYKERDGSIKSDLNYDISILPILFDMLAENKIINIDEANTVFYSITGKELKCDNQFISHYKSVLPEMIQRQIEMEEMVLI